MDLEQQLLSHFNDHSEALQQLAVTQLDAIIDASHVVVHALVNEHKVLCCGNGGAAALAQLFAAQLLSRHELERPALPALALSSDATSLTSLANDFGFSDVYAHPIRALGQAGDVLLAISTTGKSGSIVQAVRAAHERDMQVILLDGGDAGDVGALLTADDVEIQVKGSARAHIYEIQFLALNAISQLVEQQLFGGLGD